MLKRWKMKEYTDLQRARRENIAESLLATHGCLTLDDYAEGILSELQNTAVAFTTLWESGQMPVLKFDDAFKAWRDEQIRENEIIVAERITCTLPWQVLKHLDADRKESDRLYWSQGNLGSCMSHADAFAHHSSVLYWIARGAPLKYCPINPIVTWAITKGGSLRGGQCLAPNQMVYTSTGPRRASDLAAKGEPFVVLSYSKRLGRVAAKTAIAQYSNVKPCVRITTDKGSFETSYDHPFMLSTGEFVHAEKLKPGQSLMKVSTDTSSGGYVRVHLKNGKKGKAYLHRLVMSDLCGIDSEHVHHKDENKTNNHIDNLCPIKSSDHLRLHLPSMHEKATEGKRRYFSGLSQEKRSERANHLHTGEARKQHSRSQLINSGYRKINAGYDIDTESGFVECCKSQGFSPSKIEDRLNRIVNAFGSYEVYAEELLCNNHRVVSVEYTDVKRVITISVFDTEPDDKRPYSEHNYVIVPEGQTGFAMNGVCVANSVSEMAKGANEIGHFIESLVGTNNLAMPSNYKQYLDEALKYQSSILFLDFRGDELCDEIFRCCAAGLSVAVGNSNAVSGASIDKNGVKLATISGNWAHATAFTGYRKVNGTEYIGWVNSHGARYKSSDEGEPADMAWMDRKAASKFCSSMHHYGPPYAVFPESVTVHDRSLYVTKQIPWPDNWRF